MFSKIVNFIKQVIGKMFHQKGTVEAVAKVNSPLSTEMQEAIDLWYDMYMDKAYWLNKSGMKSMNLPAYISSEIARQILLEMKWSITGKQTDADGNLIPNPRAEFLSSEFAKCIETLKRKLEIGCAAGGMLIKPYPAGEHIHFDYSMDWDVFPVAFDDDGHLYDVIFIDTFSEGNKYYTRLERHTAEGDNVRITQRAFESTMKEYIGREIPLESVERWKGVVPESIVQNVGGQLFGWYRVSGSNSSDIGSPLGASVYAKATKLIRDADEQYSRLMWEFKGSELAIDVDPAALMTKPDADGELLPALDRRLFRSVDTGVGGTYQVFSPAIRDASLINGLNQILTRIEDSCGLARGTLTEESAIPKTAYELRMIKQRSYATISNNQNELEKCLRDVVRVMDAYATLYKMAPAGEYDVSFEWDDSIITDMSQQLDERLRLKESGAMGDVEIRMWYLGETRAQAEAALESIAIEKQKKFGDIVIPTVTP